MLTDGKCYEECRHGYGESARYSVQAQGVQYNGNPVYTEIKNGHTKKYDKVL